MSEGRASWTIPVAFAALTAAGDVAAADHAYAQLRYELDDPGGQCASETAFRARVASRLGYDPFRDQAGVQLRVHVIAQGKSARADITSTQQGKPSGKRSLEDSRCDALAETLASAVALLLDPVGASAPDPEPPTPPPLPPATPVVLPQPMTARSEPERPPTAPPKPTGTAIAAFAYVDATVAFARAPSAMLGARLGLGIRAGSLSLAGEAQAETVPGTTAPSAKDRIEMSAFSASLVPCGNVGALQLCGALTLGSRQATALDVDRPTTVGAFFAVVSLRAGIEVPLSRTLAFRAHGAVGIPLLRNAYTVDQSLLFTSSPLDGGLGVGLLGRFR